MVLLIILNTSLLEPYKIQIKLNKLKRLLKLLINQNDLLWQLSIAMEILLLLGFWFKLGLRWLCWYYVGYVSITLVCYPLAKCWWKIKMVKKNKDVVMFCLKVLMAAWSKGFTLVCYAESFVGRKEGKKLL